MVIIKSLGLKILINKNLKVYLLLIISLRTCYFTFIGYNVYKNSFLYFFKSYRLIDKKHFIELIKTKCHHYCDRYLYFQILHSIARKVFEFYNVQKDFLDY